MVGKTKEDREVVEKEELIQAQEGQLSSGNAAAEQRRRTFEMEPEPEDPESRDRGAMDAPDPDKSEEPQEEPANNQSGKKPRFHFKPLRDHGHMRHGPVQGGDVGEESGALLCNFVWSLSKGTGRRIGGLMVAVPEYGASHLAFYLKGRLSEKLAAESGEAGAPFSAQEGERLATKDDFVKLNVDPAAVERLSVALADRNIDSLQLAEPDGTVKFIIKAQDINAVNQALDDIIGKSDQELDEQHALMEQARVFAKDEQAKEQKGQTQDGASVNIAALGALSAEETTLDERIEDGKKDAVQRGEERKQERGQDHEVDQERIFGSRDEESDKSKSRSRDLER